jgi:hypothetical protein
VLAAYEWGNPTRTAAPGLQAHGKSVVECRDDADFAHAERLASIGSSVAVFEWRRAGSSRLHPSGTVALLEVPRALLVRRGRRAAHAPL